jgi:hypothetical protein
MMKCVKFILLSILINCTLFDATAQSIVVNDSYTAQQLVENVLVNSFALFQFYSKRRSFQVVKTATDILIIKGSFPLLKDCFKYLSSQNSQGPL